MRIQPYPTAIAGESQFATITVTKKVNNYSLNAIPFGANASAIRASDL
jgi:hypothetical protein